VQLKQEEDVLDTWFSSGLWPFATLGWPAAENDDPKSDFNRFYPTTCLETGYDILFFWVARMAMMGLELTGKSPFSVVYLHGLVRANDGSKMSKTKGNVIDPLDTVAIYGADSLRYSLVTGVTPGQDIPLNMEKIESNKHFVNKLWNICKFITSNALKNCTDEEKEAIIMRNGVKMTSEEFAALKLPEKYIVSKCHELVAEVTKDIEKYDVSAAGRKVYEFVWDEYANWYVEVSKTRLYDGYVVNSVTDAAADALMARRVLVYVFDICLRLLHPMMPFVTERLWWQLPRDTAGDTVSSLMLADWPMSIEDEDGGDVCGKSVHTFETLQGIVKAIRNARAEYNVEQGKKISCTIVIKKNSGDRAALRDNIAEEIASVIMLARLAPDDVNVIIEEEESDNEGGEEVLRLVAENGVEIVLPVSSMIDKEKEIARLTKQGEKLSKDIEKLEGRLNSPGFADKAPAAVVEKLKIDLDEFRGMFKDVEEKKSKLI
jgi:valyl-tRNA synthetase